MESMSQSEKLQLILEYEEEYHGDKFLFFKEGFITYSIDDNELNIFDVFITPLKRGKQLYHRFASEMIPQWKEIGIEFVYGCIQQDYEHKDRSIQMLKRLGMHLHSENEKILLFMKEL